MTLLAGLPEAAPGDKAPNWILFSFPPRNMEMYAWQWEKRLIPYWKEHGKIAQNHGVRLCFELHPGDMVFNPETFLRLRDAVGPIVGCLLDPSHLIWQGMDVIEVIRALEGAIYHVHAKRYPRGPPRCACKRGSGSQGFLPGQQKPQLDLSYCGAWTSGGILACLRQHSEPGRLRRRAFNRDRRSAD